MMRVMEVCLRALGKSLNDPTIDPKRNPTWDAILRKGDEETAKRVKDRCPEWQADERFYAEATAILRAVKNAWRNPTMHVEINYDEERAFEIWASVKSLIAHLATKLRE